MTHSLRDVALLVLSRVEAHLGGDERALEELKHALAAENIGADTVRSALQWLRAGVSGEAEELVPPAAGGDPARRVLSKEERRVVTPDAHGFLLGLASEGRLRADQVESILALLSGNEFPVDVDEVQELAWRMLAGDEESEIDLGAEETTIH